MRTRKAFTLVEMLAVIGIMLFLMVAAFGTFSLFAERIGPEEAMATLQGILNGARSYAAANGVDTRVEFSVSVDPVSPNRVLMQDGTVVTIKYLPPGGTAATPADWKEIPGMNRMTLGNGIFVIKDFPPNLVGMAGLPAGDVVRWKQREKDNLDAATTLVKNHMPDFKPRRSNEEWPNIQFDPAGYLVEDTASGTGPQALTVVQLLGDFDATSGDTQPRVMQYRIYLLNAHSGTRLVFE